MNKPKQSKKKLILKPQVKDGEVKGEYSTALWNNGELVSFDIDWDKLKKIVESLK